MTVIQNNLKNMYKMKLKNLSQNNQLKKKLLKKKYFKKKNK